MAKTKTNAQLVKAYMTAVTKGRVVVGDRERWAVERHLSDLKNAKIKGLRFDEDLASAACDFFPLLKHTTGEYAGQPFELMPFQRFIIWSIFGWLNARTGVRRFTQAFVSMARGNGKSPFAAAIVLLMFCFDCPIEQRAECYTAATKKKQSKIVFDEVRRFVEQSPQLRRLIRVMASRLVIPSTDSTLEPLGQDSENMDGLVPHVISADELHAWQNRHRELWDKLLTSLTKRTQPLLLVITTAGSDDSEIWEEEYDLACQVVDPSVPLEVDKLFVFIAQIDDDDDPFDEAVWQKANPLLGVGVVKIDALRSLASQARVDPRKKNTLTRYHCNQKTTSLTKYMTPEIWQLGSDDLPDLEGLPCHAGFDWGWRDDLAAIALVFPLDTIEVVGEDEEGNATVETRRRFAAFAKCWIPSECPRNLAEEPWAGWINSGQLAVAGSNCTDTAAIYRDYADLAKRYDIRTIAMDPNNCREFGTRVEAEHGTTAFWFGQSFGRYNEPMRELKLALQEGRFIHGNAGLLGWAMLNVVAEEDSREYTRPAKKRSKDKIDPACSLLMATSECLFAEQTKPSIYSNAGSLYD